MPEGLTRRQFLQLGAAAAAGVTFTGCQAPKREFVAQSRPLLAEELVDGYQQWYATTCRGCDAGCGAIVRVVAGRAKKLEGNPAVPLNLGRSCARAQASVQELYHPDRLRGPLLRSGERGQGGFVPTGWDDGLDRLVAVLRAARDGGRAGQVALLTRPLGGHQALVVERFARAYGLEWLRLDPLPRTPFEAAVQRVFGFQRLPALDLANASYVLSFGADFLGTWLSPVHYGVQYGVFRQGWYEAGRFAPRRETDRPRGHLVQVEPRFSTTAANADEWIWVRPGREGLLARSLAQVILSEGLADPNGARAFGDPGSLEGYRPEQVVEATGVPAERIRRLAREFATRRPSLAFGGGPAAAQTNGTDNLAAVLALNLLVGSVGQPGGVLPNPEPYLDLPERTPATDLPTWQEFLERARNGQVQAILVHDADPLYGLPAALQAREALARVPFLVSLSSFLDETTLLADLVLPSRLPLESWGDAVPSPGPGYRVLTLQQPVVRPLYDTRPFADVLLTAAEELGGPLVEALPWPTFKDVLRDGARRLRPGGDDLELERFWVQLLQQGGVWEEGPAAASGAAQGQAVPAPAEPRFAGEAAEYPLHLVVFEHNTLGDGRGAHLPWLQAAPDPTTTVVWQTWVELNPGLAERYGLREGDLVAVETPHGRLEAPVYLSPAAPPDVLGIPMGWGHTAYGRWAGGRGVNPMAILAPLMDQATGALAYAASRARLVRTGRSTALAKLEGTVPARQLPDEEVLKVTGV